MNELCDIREVTGRHASRALVAVAVCPIPTLEGGKEAVEEGHHREREVRKREESGCQTLKPFSSLDMTPGLLHLQGVSVPHGASRTLVPNSAAVALKISFARQAVPWLQLPMRSVLH